MKAIVIVPTYNEAENIERLLGELNRLPVAPDILVVDDQSPDGTADRVREIMRHAPNVHLLLRKEKRGLAAAYQAGFLWGFERGYDALVQMDADFSHPPEKVPVLLEALKKYDVAVGSRYVSGGSVSGWGLLRQLISRGGNIYARTVLHAPCQDLTGGFNAWKHEALRRVAPHTLRSQGYSFQVEMKYRAIFHGFRLTEVPIHFENRKLGKSKMSGGIVWEAAFRVFQMKLSPPG